MNTTSIDKEKNLNNINERTQTMKNNNFNKTTQQKNGANTMSYIHEARPIVPQFVELINQFKSEQGTIPSKKLIHFRDWGKKNERQVFTVPIKYLHFRSNNGRIASDVKTYIKRFGPIEETKEEHQKILGEMLREKDISENKILKASIDSIGQLEPAIITVDGFLVDGNRRKFTFNELAKDNPHKSGYQYMTVVFLPADVTDFEIQQLENRYQLQKDGKSDYHLFDQALTIKNNIDIGISLEDQLAANPANGNPGSKQFKTAITKAENGLLGPLQYLDRYLIQIDRPGEYTYVANDQRWQAMIDAHQKVFKKVSLEAQRIKLGVQEDEVGKIISITNKVIRSGGLNDEKLHETIRKIPKILKIPEAKNEFLKIDDDVSNTLPGDKQFSSSGEEYSDEQKEKMWKKRHEESINKHLRISKRIIDDEIEDQTPLLLVKEAEKKLTHKNMKTIENICDNSLKELMNELDKVMEAAEKIYQKADHLRQKEVK